MLNPTYIYIYIYRKGEKKGKKGRNEQIEKNVFFKRKRVFAFAGQRVHAIVARRRVFGLKNMRPIYQGKLFHENFINHRPNINYVAMRFHAGWAVEEEATKARERVEN